MSKIDPHGITWFTIFLSLILLFFSFASQGVDKEKKEETENPEQAESSYFLTYPGKRAASLFLSSPSVTVDASNEVSGKDLRLQTNSHPLMGPGYVTQSFSIKPEFLKLPVSDSSKGDTKDFHLGFDYFPRNSSVYFEGKYNWSQGFYLENSGDFEPGKSYILYPDLRSIIAVLEALYVRSADKLSISAAKGGIERQLKSTWSWVGLFGIQYIDLSSNQSHANLDLSFHEVKQGSVHAMGGISGVWVYQYFYALGEFDAGPMVYYQTLNLEKKFSSSGIQLATRILVSFGLDFDSFSLFVAGENIQNSVVRKNGSLSVQLNEGRSGLSYRF